LGIIKNVCNCWVCEFNLKSILSDKEEKMKFKKLAIICAVLIAVGAFTISNSYAAEWDIVGKVVRSGMIDDHVLIVIKDNGDNLWGANAVAAFENEILATGLTALAGDLTVWGVYDTVANEWVGLAVISE